MSVGIDTLKGNTIDYVSVGLECDGVFQITQLVFTSHNKSN